MFSYIKEHKIATSFICINLVLIIVVIAIIVIYHAKTAVVDIHVAPSQATITLNGKSYQNHESHEIIPGNYHVEISMAGMQTKEYNITLEKNGYIKIHNYLLDAGGGFSYYLSRPNDVAILTEVAEADDTDAQAFLTEYNKKISVLSYIPINYDAYSDDFATYTQYSIYQDTREDCPKIACLAIEDNTGGNEQIAKDRIKELGYNLDDYEISYNYVPLYTANEVVNE